MIQIRAMSQKEYDAYQDYLEELQEQGIKDNRLIRKLINYVCEKIYGMDLDDKNNTPGLCMYVFTQTNDITNRMDEEELKNLVKSGIGELKVEQNSVKPAEKEASK